MPGSPSRGSRWIGAGCVGLFALFALAMTVMTVVMALQPGQDRWIVVMALFPLAFAVLLGWLTVRILSSSDPVLAGPLTGKARPRDQRVFMTLFFGVFLMAGLAFFVFMFVRPVLGVLRAAAWIPTPCVVLSSRVQTHSGDDGNTYSIEIQYQYQAGGRTYTSKAYDFSGGSSSGYEGKAAVVREHPPGRETVCYVNPSVPTEAVLQRGFSASYLIGLFPLIFVAVGAGGIYAGWRRPRPKERTPPEPGGAVTLRPGRARAGKLAAVIFIALFWNGIVAVFVVQAVHGHRAGHPDWFLTIFMVPFVAVGLFLLVLVVCQLLALFNPTPELRLTSTQVPLGEAFEVDWRIDGSTDRLRRLRITLEGVEEATYRRGTDSVTDRRTFAELVLVDTDGAPPRRGDRVRVVLPADSMHSFESPNNKIVWNLHVKGEIPRWPDIDDAFPFTVLPRRDA